MVFKEFKISDIFLQERGKEASPSKVLDGDTPMIAEIDSNNGFTKYANPTKTFKGNAITISVNFARNVFYQPVDFCASVNILIIRNDFLNEKNAQYICSVLRKNNEKYDYQNKISKERLNDTIILLPTSDGINPDYDYMDSFISELEQERISELEQERISELDNYLRVSGLNDYALTARENELINLNVNFKEFKITDIFKVINTHSILKEEVVFNSGNIPYVTASEGNNSIVSYVNAEPDIIDKGNCVLIGGKTMVVTYQEKDFVSNDSHNLALYLLDDKYQTKNIYLYMASAIYKSLGMKYHWGDSISKKKIYEDSVKLPIDNNGKPYYTFMEEHIKVMEKLVIKEVVEYKDKVINKIKQICNL